MKKFMVIYHAPVEAIQQIQNNTPEQSNEGMEAWMKWAQKCGEHLVDLGTPLGMGQKINVDGSSQNSDKQVCGYSVLQAKDMDHAKELIKDHPHLAGWDNACEIEIHESLPLPE